MLKLEDGLEVLLKKAATSLPSDVEEAIKSAYEREPAGSPSKEVLAYILENVQTAKASQTPLCQDTGTPIFYVKIPRELGFKTIQESITRAVRKATASIPLRPNAVDPVSEKNTGDNTGPGIPEIYIEQSDEGNLEIDLSLKGAGSENSGTFYRLPDPKLGAERDFNGVRKCVLDAVHNAQGRGCPPYTIGVGIAGTRLMAAKLSRLALMRRLPDEAPEEKIKELERTLFKEINELGIGAMGLGGACTALGVKVEYAYRHTGSYFVDVSFACWANRRGRLVW
jgi:fumarate hydratase class I